MKEEQYIRTTEDGNKLYYSDRKMTILHREDGPAFESADGGKCWYINGEILSEEEFNDHHMNVELTLDDIAAKFGVSVDRLKIKK